MQIDWWTLAIQAVNFLVLVWLLQRFLYRPVQQVIQKRQAMAEQVMGEAQHKADDADAARQRYEASLDGLESKKRDIVEQVHKDMQQEGQKLLDAASAEADRILEEARAEAEKERAKTLSNLKAEIADLATGIATQMLKTSGAATLGPGTFDAVKRYFDDMPDSDLEELRVDLAGKSARLEVVTASALTEQDKSAWQDRLRDWLETDSPVSFVTSADILGGIELRFPHSVLSFSWAGEIRAATERMIGAPDER